MQLDTTSVLLDKFDYMKTYKMMQIITKLYINLGHKNAFRSKVLIKA